MWLAVMGADLPEVWIRIGILPIFFLKQWLGALGLMRSWARYLLLSHISGSRGKRKMKCKPRRVNRSKQEPELPITALVLPFPPLNFIQSLPKTPHDFVAKESLVRMDLSPCLPNKKPYHRVPRGGILSQLLTAIMSSPLHLHYMCKNPNSTLKFTLEPIACLLYCKIYGICPYLICDDLSAEVALKKYKAPNLVFAAVLLVAMLW